MPSIVHQLTALYVFVDDFLQVHLTLAAWRRSPNATPAFSDAEVLTLALLQDCLGVATLRHTYRLIAANYRAAFLHRCSYGQWLARLHALTPLVGHLIQGALGHSGRRGRACWPSRRRATSTGRTAARRFPRAVGASPNRARTRLSE